MCICASVPPPTSAAEPRRVAPVSIPTATAASTCATLAAGCIMVKQQHIAVTPRRVRGSLSRSARGRSQRALSRGDRAREADPLPANCQTSHLSRSDRLPGRPSTGYGTAVPNPTFLPPPFTRQPDVRYYRPSAPRSTSVDGLPTIILGLHHHRNPLNGPPLTLPTLGRTRHRLQQCEADGA